MKGIIIGIFGYVLFNRFILDVPADYGTMMIWGCGCVLGELIGKSLFKEKK